MGGKASIMKHNNSLEVVTTQEQEEEYEQDFENPEFEYDDQRKGGEGHKLVSSKPRSYSGRKEIEIRNAALI